MKISRFISTLFSLFCLIWFSNSIILNNLYFKSKDVYDKSQRIELLKYLFSTHTNTHRTEFEPIELEIAKLYYQQGKYNEALFYLKNLTRYDPNNGDALLLKVRILQETYGYEKTVTGLLFQIIGIHNSHYEANLLLLEQFMYEGDCSKIIPQQDKMNALLYTEHSHLYFDTYLHFLKKNKNLREHKCNCTDKKNESSDYKFLYHIVSIESFLENHNSQLRIAQ